MVFLSVIFSLTSYDAFSQKTATPVNTSYHQLLQAFQHPPQAAKPWVFWYWMQAAVSKEGITADLQAMKEAGIGGAYLMPIKGTANPPLMNPPVEQLTPAWWDMVKFAISEAGRLGLQIGMHVSDGFALAGGPWITPELSMQKVVWSQTHISGGQPLSLRLQQPETVENYYKDIAILAFPSPIGDTLSTKTITPEVSSNKTGDDLQFLATDTGKRSFSSNEACWIQYRFDQPFTCRSILIKTSGNNYQAQRLGIEISNDGVTFQPVGRLQPPRHGWQDTDADVTHTIKPVTAKYFRFVYDKEGSEPGAEDLDAAKWKPNLKISGIILSAAPRINQYEGKNGEVWRISRATTAEEVPDSVCIAPDKMIDLTKNVDSNGQLQWNAPAGNWTVLRLGHTSTGHTNATGGGGKGLECDKFNPVAARLQFDSWFGKAVAKAGPELAGNVLKIFHIDSWECGSQNWSVNFGKEFEKRRGYNLLKWLPAMAGLPVKSAKASEQFLYDVRQTIAELVVDSFYTIMKEKAHQVGCIFTAESMAPTMLSDGMLHYKESDIPMGEFWLNSPTHDKPNDMLDAVSGAHVYGKNIVQAEAFTTVRMAWNEHPGMLKALQDRNYALGINKLVYHVFAHNPWMDKAPGMTLDGVGLYFQRDQTWWKPGKAWVDYAQRCQALLQLGKPVTDIAVFTGEELPRRSVLPDRLVPVLPGVMGKKKVEWEEKRLSNKGEPIKEKPAGVFASANITNADDWVDPLRGYSYDSFNPDALLRLAQVKNGRIELPGGASYGLLVLPGATKMTPGGSLLSPESAVKLRKLVNDGATVIVNDQNDSSALLKSIIRAGENKNTISGWLVTKDSAITGRLFGKGRIVKAPYYAASFSDLNMDKDVLFTDNSGTYVDDIAWTHRKGDDFDIYFISNSNEQRRTFEVSLRVNGKMPELWNAVSGEVAPAREWKVIKGRTVLPLQLEASESIFIVLAKPAIVKGIHSGVNWSEAGTIQTLTGSWEVAFDKSKGGPDRQILFNELSDWSQSTDSRIKYYSGAAIYTKAFNWKTSVSKTQDVWLDLGKVANIASVKVNGINCGTVWTPPFRVNIAKALKQGINELQIEVTNTWANRLMGDHLLPEAERIANTVAPYRLEGKSLNEAGLLGPVTIKPERPLTGKRIKGVM